MTGALPSPTLSCSTYEQSESSSNAHVLFALLWVPLNSLCTGLLSGLKSPLLEAIWFLFNQGEGDNVRHSLWVLDTRKITLLCLMLILIFVGGIWRHTLIEERLCFWHMMACWLLSAHTGEVCNVATKATLGTFQGSRRDSLPKIKPGCLWFWQVMEMKCEMAQVSARRWTIPGLLWLSTYQSSFIPTPISLGIKNYNVDMRKLCHNGQFGVLI